MGHEVLMWSNVQLNLVVLTGKIGENPMLTRNRKSSPRR